MLKRPLKPNLTEKRLETIDSIRDAIQKLREDYKRDFAEPNPLGPAIERDLEKAVESLDFLKSFYKSKTERTK
jgi:hypothetical protein